jgi:hypothetical protein
MALSKGAKIAIIFATIGVTGVAGYFIYNAIKKRMNSGDGENPLNTPQNVNEGNENSNEKTPFKNKAQGDIFRQWVNRFFRSYAEEIDLDVSGDFDNSFIRKAWGKYGEAYKKGNPNFEKVSGNAIPQNLLNAFAKDKNNGLIGNNSSGNVYLQTKSLGKLGSSGKDVYAYFYSDGKVSFNSDNKRVLYPNWGKVGTEIYVGSKVYVGSDYFETAKKVLDWYNNPASASQILTLNFDGKRPKNGNLSQDVDAPSRRGLTFDTNIID